MHPRRFEWRSSLRCQDVAVRGLWIIPIAAFAPASAAEPSPGTRPARRLRSG